MLVSPNFLCQGRRFVWKQSRLIDRRCWQRLMHVTKFVQFYFIENIELGCQSRLSTNPDERRDWDEEETQIFTDLETCCLGWWLEKAFINATLTLIGRFIFPQKLRSIEPLSGGGWINTFVGTSQTFNWAILADSIKPAKLTKSWSLNSNISFTYLMDSIKVHKSRKHFIHFHLHLFNYKTPRFDQKKHR